MAPTKRKAEQAESAAEPARVTRSAGKRAAASSVDGLARQPQKKSKKGKGGGKGKKEEEKVVTVESGKVEGDSSDNVIDASDKTIVIEHCKQCNSFKTRATIVKEGLERRASGITVIVNPEKPRRGCFEIREEGGKKFISLLDMKRPFRPMKDLDMDKVVSDIIDDISSTS